MSEDSPRVTVHLPGGVRPARLVRWRQGPDGRWWAEVALYAPAEAVARVDGEDYSAVPREPQPATEPRYVLDRLPAGANGKPRLVLHVAGCWVIGTKKLSPPTPVPDGRQAQSMLRFDDTTACDVCNPGP